MNIEDFIFKSQDNATHRRNAVYAVTAWLLITLLLASKHVFWRDEVRALLIATQGDNLFEMLKGLRGEGHPAVWYILLRAANNILSSTVALPATSMLVALVAMALISFRSPFSWPLIGAFLFGRASVYEYSVMTRNYGISVVLMFTFSWLYPRYRYKGIALGSILFLLANCNLHSVILVAMFLLFWLIDISPAAAQRKLDTYNNFLLNAAIAAAGIAVCALTVYPSVHNAAQMVVSHESAFFQVAKAIVTPSTFFSDIVGGLLWQIILGPLSLSHLPYTIAWQLLTSALLVGSTLGLLNRPAAFIAAVASLFGLSVFFATVYPGDYRHQALWFVFLICMYWIAGRENTQAGAYSSGSIARNIGQYAFYALVSFQLLLGMYTVLQIGFGSVPESRSRDLSLIISGSEELKDAIIIADPDYLVEPLPYYIPNRTYLMRENRFGNVVVFTRNARLTLNLDDILVSAYKLRAETGKPIVILIKKKLDPVGPAEVIKEGYNWQLVTTPDQVRNFLSLTRHVHRFDPACCSDESFDMYVLN